MFLSVDYVCSCIYSSDTSQGAHHRYFLALMVALPDLQLQHLPGCPSSTFLSVDGGRSQIYSFSTSQGDHRRRILSVDGGRSRIYSSGTS
jgi:hypothetical protein